MVNGIKGKAAVDYSKLNKPQASVKERIVFWIARKVVVEKSKFWSKISDLFLSKSALFLEMKNLIKNSSSTLTTKQVSETPPANPAVSATQTAWTKKTEQGFLVDGEQLETTEGFGAYLDMCLKPNTRNFDNGGGSYNYNSLFLKQYVGVTNVVYDPFQRTSEDNQKVLEELAKHNFDTATSNSVLNVVDNKEARLKHISYSCEALKEGGIAYFKVYPGNKSGKEKILAHGYQSNRLAETYQKEVEAIFGVGNVVVDRERHMLIAYKNSGCK